MGHQITKWDFFKILSRMSNDVLRLRAGKGSIKLWGGVGERRRGVCLEGRWGWGMGGGGGGGWGDFRSNAPLNHQNDPHLKKERKKKRKKEERL